MLQTVLFKLLAHFVKKIKFFTLPTFLYPDKQISIHTQKNGKCKTVADGMVLELQNFL
jgi:hypothetical protein